MRQDFYIFRHGQTDYNQSGRWQGSGIDAPLNETGKEQIRALIPEISLKEIQILYASRLRRAAESAKIIASELNLPLAFCSDLREICLGAAEGLCIAEAEAKYPKIFRGWFDPAPINDGLRFPGGESKFEARRRMMNAIEQIGRSNPQFCRFGVVSHEDAIVQLLAAFGIFTPHIANASLCHLIINDGQWTIDI